MKRCFVDDNHSQNPNSSSCVCSDNPPEHYVPCIVQFKGQTGRDFVSGLASSTGSFLGSSGLLSALALSLGVSVLFRSRG
jgi:hypothetical protein